VVDEAQAKCVLLALECFTKIAIIGNLIEEQTKKEDIFG